MTNDLEGLKKLLEGANIEFEENKNEYLDDDERYTLRIRTRTSNQNEGDHGLYTEFLFSNNYKLTKVGIWEL